MVAFGKKLKVSQIQEWQGYYINYKLLKKKVNQYTRLKDNGSRDHLYFLKDFSKMLDIQIEKIALFILEQQGLLASRLSHLREEHESQLRTGGGLVNKSEIQESYRAVGRDLLRLLFFVEMNAIGLRKILKKFDKRFGYRFANYYVKTRANHPYSQLQQVFKHVGFGAVVGAISRNLFDLQDHEGSHVSIYDKPALHLQDPVVHSIKRAVDRLTNSTSFLQYLGKHALILQEVLPSLSEQEETTEQEEYHLTSLLLNLVNTFLYMVNTYIIVPTADDYALSLGAAATVCGVVIGSMAVAQMFSSVYFSAWSNRSYFRPLVFSSVVLFLGNLLYAMAYDFHSVSLLLVGRLLCGLGSARAVNRRYISDCVPSRMRLKASAGFVSASALGMACGPALAVLFQTKFRLLKFTFNKNTLPGWFMAVAWLVYLLWLWISFKEPPKPPPQASIPPPQESNPGLMEHSNRGDNALTKPLILSLEENGEDEDDDEDDDDDHDEEEGQEGDNNGKSSAGNHKPVTSIIAAYKLLTPSVKVQLLIYFMLKYAVETILAASSVITTHYFVWSTQNVAIFLACLGLTVLPVNVVVGTYLSNLFEERQVLIVSEIVVCLGIIASFNIIIPYSVAQYVSSSLITFVAAEVLEGVNLSLLSRMMSSRLSRGTYNGGLLSTEAGTLARVLADGAITLVGYWGESRLLNTTLLPSLFVCVSSIVATCFTYNSLY